MRFREEEKERGLRRATSAEPCPRQNGKAKRQDTTVLFFHLIYSMIDPAGGLESLAADLVTRGDYKPVHSPSQLPEGAAADAQHGCLFFWHLGLGKVPVQWHTVI